MTNPKWEIGPVKLVGGYEAHLDFFCESRQIWIGRFQNDKGQWHGADWDTSGRHENLTQSMGLAPPPKKTVRVRCWLNVYSDGTVNRYWSRLHADNSIGVTYKRIACIEIDREVTEGEGL